MRCWRRDTRRDTALNLSPGLQQIEKETDFPRKRPSAPSQIWCNPPKRRKIRGAARGAYRNKITGLVIAKQAAKIYTVVKLFLVGNFIPL